MAEPADLTSDQIRQRVAQLGTWYHNVNLRGVRTAPDHPFGDYPACHWQRFADKLPQDMRGWTVLDIGCNAGFYCLEMKRRGADRVVGIDADDGHLAQARFAAEVCGLDVELKQLSVYDVGRLEETFDLVLFMGAMYQLRHPLLALDLIHNHVAKNLLVVQTMLRGSDQVFKVADDYPFHEQRVFDNPGFPKLNFIENLFAGDPTNWWLPNRACVEALLRSAGFAPLDNPDPEVFLCHRQPFPTHTQAAYAARRAYDHD